MKQKPFSIAVCLLCILCSLLLFTCGGTVAEKIVDRRIDAAFEKERQERYDLLYVQLEAQGKVDADVIDFFMEMELLPPLRQQYYESRQAEKKRANDISSTKTTIQVGAAGLFLLGAGGLVWSLRKKPDS